MYIGDLGEDATRRELEEAFDKFGRVRNVWIAKRPPGGWIFGIYGGSVIKTPEQALLLSLWTTRGTRRTQPGSLMALGCVGGE